MPMLILTASAMGLVLVVLAVVVIGIGQEPSAQELTRQAPSVMARLARPLLGAYVRRPDPSVILENHRGNRARPHSVPLANRTDTPDEGGLTVQRHRATS